MMKVPLKWMGKKMNEVFLFSFLLFFCCAQLVPRRVLASNFHAFGRRWRTAIRGEPKNSSVTIEPVGFVYLFLVFFCPTHRPAGSGQGAPEYFLQVTFSVYGFHVENLKKKMTKRVLSNFFFAACLHTVRNFSL